MMWKAGFVVRCPTGHYFLLLVVKPRDVTREVHATNRGLLPSYSFMLHFYNSSLVDIKKLISGPTILTCWSAQRLGEGEADRNRT